MSYKFAMIGLATLAATAAASPSWAMPNGLPSAAQPQAAQENAEQVRYVCDWRGRCWWRPGPRYYGSYAWGPRWHRGYGYGGRHHRHWRRW